MTIFTVYELASFDANNVDIFYIKQEKRQQGDDISPIIFAYTAIIAAIILPQMHQID